MNIFSLVKKFRSDESGAVTVDWVVLTAAIVGLGVLVVSTIGGSIDALGDRIAGEINTVDPTAPALTAPTTP